MFTSSAVRSLPRPGRTVDTVPHLVTLGWTVSAVRAQLAARRWQRFGRALLLHNGLPDADERRAIALFNCGEHALLTSFTGAAVLGLAGWERGHPCARSGWDAGAARRDCSRSRPLLRRSS